MLICALLASIVPAYAEMLEPADPPPSSEEHTTSGGNTTNTWNYNIGFAEFGDVDAETINIGGVNSDLFKIVGETVNITVYGDFLVPDYQFNPVVGELWSGNAQAGNALWNPTLEELPKWLIDQCKLRMGYAYLYDGYYTTGNNQSYKPSGATRIGEVLGYDVYAAEGEKFVDRNNVFTVQSSSYLTDTAIPSLRWAVCNIYRALGQEIYNYNFIRYRWKYWDEEKLAHIDPTGSAAIRTIRGASWDHNTSPVAGFLTGNIDVEFDGDFHPVVILAASRTNFDQYMERANRDRVNLNMSNSKISRIDFLTLVWELMYIYGEPVMTEQEQYMLLEAYGRQLPWDLNSYQLDAVRNLLCRGICDTDILSWNWYENITFEDACTILMRVKDVGSRLTFKEFQLTTDLALLQKGYYPTRVSLIESEFIYAEPVASDTINSYYYDFYVRRSDNRALFQADMAANPDGARTPSAVAPHVSPGRDQYYTQVEGSLYCGVDEYGYAHFRVPISWFSSNDFKATSSFYINSMNSGNDDPGQYILTLGPGQIGGVYVLDAGSGAFAYTSFDNSPLYSDPGNTDFTRYDAATKTQRNYTGTKDNNSPYTEWVIDVPRSCFAEWKDDSQSWVATNKGDWVYGSTATYVYTEQQKEGTLQDAISSGAKFTRKGGFTNSAGTSKTVEAYVDGTFSKATSASYYRLRIICGDGLTKEEVNEFLDYNENSVRRQSTLLNATAGYMMRNNSTLLSVDYLTSIGYIKSFVEEDVGLGKAYRMVVSNGSTSQTDVFVVPDKCMVVFGQCVYIFDQTRELVWTNTTGQKYIDLCIVNGKMTQTLAGKYSGDVTIISSYEDCGVDTHGDTLHQWGDAVSNPATVYTTTYNEDFYVNTARTTINANYIAYYDTTTMDGGVFFLYARPDDSYKGKDTVARNTFMRVFDMKPSDAEALYFYYVPLTPAGRHRAGEADTKNAIVVSTLQDTILFKVSEAPESGVPSADAPSIYYVVEEEIDWGTDGGTPYDVTSFFLCAPCYNTDNEPIIFKTASNYDINARVLTSYKEVGDFREGIASDNTLSGYRIGVAGLPAIIAGMSLKIDDSAFGGSGLSRASVFYYIGNCYVYSLKTGNFLADGYLLHEYVGDGQGTSGITVTRYYYVSLRSYSWNAPNDVAPGATGVKPVVGEPNKFTDWLTWLKDAQLSDAEDILTICIIAALQWIPRIFMFLFIMLMALSMIANVKPWQKFCDTVVDPYKVLTAGRQTVHTIDLKKTVLFSLIALVAFGFFQNGLILEIIGWIARAVVGILHR